MTKKNGFTLIEVLLTVTILSVFFGIGYASFRDYSRRQVLEGLGRQLRGDLRTAQENALAGVKPDSSFPTHANCDSPHVLNSYGFFAPNATTYYIYAACDGGNINLPTRTLPAGYSVVRTYNPPIAPVPVQFKTLGQGTTLPAGVNAVITITNTTTGATNVVTVTDSGTIK